MSDIVKRLRKRAPHWNVIDAENMLEGAARIEALEAENRQLRAALAEQDEAAVYVPTVVSWSGGPMPFATIRVRLDETPTEYEYVPAHNTAEQAQPVAWKHRDHREILDADPREWGRADEPWIPLYTTPPAPVVPQPLTDEDIHLITGHCGVSKHAAISIARAVEAEVLRRMWVQR